MIQRSSRTTTVKYAQGRASSAAFGTTKAAVLIHWQTSSVSIRDANLLRLNLLQYATSRAEGQALVLELARCDVVLASLFHVML